MDGVGLFCVFVLIILGILFVFVVLPNLKSRELASRPFTRHVNVSSEAYKRARTEYHPYLSIGSNIAEQCDITSEYSDFSPTTFAAQLVAAYNIQIEMQGYPDELKIPHVVPGMQDSEAASAYMEKEVDKYFRRELDIDDMLVAQGNAPMTRGHTNRIARLGLEGRLQISCLSDSIQYELKNFAEKMHYHNDVVNLIKIMCELFMSVEFATSRLVKEGQIRLPAKRPE